LNRSAFVDDLNMPKTGRAAVFHSPNRPLELRDANVPDLLAGEVLIRVRLCTLCGSDLHTYRGKRATPTPTILGHEIIGDVVEVAGSARNDLAGRPVKCGDRVTWSIASRCGKCFYCTNGLPQKCERLFKYGHEQLTDARPLSGGLAEYCVLTADTPILVLPPSLPDAVACIANCATATVAGAMRTAGDCREQHVLILGAGMLGLNAAAMATRNGARAVYVADVSPERLARAVKFGATACFPFTDNGDDLIAELRNRTDGRGVDLVIEVSGAPAAMAASLRALRIGGRVVFVGAVAPTPPLPIDPEQVVRRLLTIRGLHNYVPEDLAAAVEFLAETESRFPFAELIGSPFPLSEIDAAFAEALTGRVLRVAVRP
jgi:alcohol dehydrogenase